MLPICLRKLPPHVAFEILAYSVTPAARWDIRPLLFQERLSAQSQDNVGALRLGKAQEYSVIVSEM